VYLCKFLIIRHVVLSLLYLLILVFIKLLFICYAVKYFEFYTICSVSIVVSLELLALSFYLSVFVVVFCSNHTALFS